jgi:hypothetical protein
MTNELKTDLLAVEWNRRLGMPLRKLGNAGVGCIYGTRNTGNKKATITSSSMNTDL